MALFVEVMGWLGASLILLAYVLLTHHDLDSKSRIYQWLNLVGALLISVNSFTNKSYPAFGLNVVWIFVAMYGLYKIFKK